MTSLSIQLNRDKILKAYKQVVDGEPDNWVIYCYAKNSRNELDVASEGDYGLDEFCNEFNVGQIQYGIIKVQCPKSSLGKMLLINWQGEGVSGIILGRAANHVQEIGRFFKGIHVTMHARNEDDIDPELCLAEISRASATSYTFKADNGNRLMDQEPPDRQNIGTNYERIKNPAAAIASTTEREQFWARQIKDDEDRLAREAAALKLKEENAAAELKEKEAESAKNRAKLVKERVMKISKQERPQDIAGLNTGPMYRGVPNMNGHSGQATGNSTSPRGSVSSSIASSGSNNMVNGAKPFQSSATPTYQKLNYNPNPVSHPPQSSYVKNVAGKIQGQSATKSASTTSHDNPFKKTTPNSKTSSLNSSLSGTFELNPQTTVQPVTPPAPAPITAVAEPQSQPTPEPPVHSPPQPAAPTAPAPEQQAPVQAAVVTPTGNPVSAAYAQDVAQAPQPALKSARALYDYDADDDTEISFLPGDIVTEIDMFDEGWWTGRGPDGRVGMFPANYVQLI